MPRNPAWPDHQDVQETTVRGEPEGEGFRKSPADPHDPSADRVADLLLDIGTVLLASGAHSARIVRNLDRIAETWGYDASIHLSFTGILISLRHATHPHRRAIEFRSCGAYGVHFGILTETSLLSWKVVVENLTVDEVESRWQTIKTLPHHPRVAILAGIGLACASLCLLLQGDFTDAGFALLAAVCGMAVRQQVLHLRFNPMIGFIAASLVTTLIAGVDIVHRIGGAPEAALAASVLYLVPGVPLINCTIDLIEGHVPIAIARGVFGGFILLCIAVGMSIGITLLGIRNF